MKGDGDMSLTVDEIGKYCKCGLVSKRYVGLFVY